MQQLNCYQCSKPSVKRITCNKTNVIHAIKHISFFFPRESQPPLFLMNSPTRPLYHLFSFSFENGISLLFSLVTILSHLMDPLFPPLLYVAL